MGASAVRGGQVYVEIGANPAKLLGALRSINTKVANVGDTLRSTGIGMSALGAAIAGPIMAVGGAFVEQTAEMQAMRRAVADIGKAVGETVAPAFVGMANIIAGASRALAKFIRENQHLVRLAVAVGGYLTAWGTATYAVGIATTTLARGVTMTVGPVSTFLSLLKAVGVAAVAFASSGPILAAVAVLAGLGVGAVAAGADLRKLAGTIGEAFANPIGNLKAVFGDLLGTVNLTVEGIYRAISAGDLAGAVDVLWAGWQAAWARGEQAVMGSLDPWIEAVQNKFSDFGVGLAAWWDQTWTDIATSNWGAYLLAALDTVINAQMAYWDYMFGWIEKGWTELWRRLGRISNEQAAAEFARIDAANAANAQRRGRDRPGFAGRTGLTDEQKARMQQESRDRQAAMFDAGEQMRRDRAARTARNVIDRRAAVEQANRNLQDQVNRFPVPQAPVIVGNVAQKVTGTFSAFGIGQIGSFNVEQQQLEELKQIRQEIKRQGAAVVA